METLVELKQRYNEKLKRNNKAEQWFENHTVEECIKQLDLFNQVVQELSKLIKNIESMTYRKMTQQEILNGFEV